MIPTSGQYVPPSPFAQQPGMNPLLSAIVAALHGAGGLGAMNPGGPNVAANAAIAPAQLHVASPTLTAQDNLPAPLNAGAVAAGTAPAVYSTGSAMKKPVAGAFGVAQPHLLPHKFPQPRGSGFANAYRQARKPAASNALARVIAELVPI